jgi:prepilin-type N-terminal cleavage/methylation domain-containing protein
MTRSASACRRAYTLVEILIVVTLLGIASALVIPQISSTDVLRVQASVRTLVSDINYAQSDALARQEARAIVFDVDNNLYSVVAVPGNTINLGTDTMYVVNFNENRKFHDTKIVDAVFDGDNVLLFDELGGPITAPGTTAPGAGGKATITGSSSTFEVGVEAYTGRVTVTRISP